MADLTLSTAVRSNLLSLQNTQDLIDRTQGRLSTGLKVGSPIDDAVKYFQGKALSERAADLTERKASIDQGISALDTALKAADAIESLVSQMKGIVDSARSADAAQRSEYAKSLKELSKQIEKLVNDASYQGLNLLNSSSSKLSVRFSEKTDSKMDVDGVDFQSSAFYLDSGGSATTIQLVSATNVVSGGLGFGLLLSAFNLDNAEQLASFNAQADLAVKRLDQTISNVRAKSANMGASVAILNVRSEFTKQYVNALDTGAGKLTVADLNEEGANLLALQTRQQLGIQALSFAGQSEQGILGLFR